MQTMVHILAESASSGGGRDILTLAIAVIGALVGIGSCVVQVLTRKNEAVDERADKNASALRERNDKKDDELRDAEERLLLAEIRNVAASVANLGNKIERLETDIQNWRRDFDRRLTVIETRIGMKAGGA